MTRMDASCAAVSPCAPLALCWTEPQEPSHGDYAFFPPSTPLGPPAWDAASPMASACGESFPWHAHPRTASPSALPGRRPRLRAGKEGAGQRPLAVGASQGRNRGDRAPSRSASSSHACWMPWKGKCSRGPFRAAARRRRPIVVVGSSHVSLTSIDPPSVMTVASRGFTSARCRGERPSRSRGLLGAPSIVVSPSVACHPTLRHCPRCAL